MKINKKVMVIILIICLSALIVACRGYYFESKHKCAIDKQDILNNSKPIIDVNGKKIEKAEFDLLKESYGDLKTDEEILSQLINQELLYTESKKMGFTVSKEEIDEMLDKNRAIVQSNEETYNNSLKKYLKGLNMTEEEYWISTRTAYEHLIYEYKYKTYLKEEFNKNNSEFDDSEFQMYYNENLKNLKETAVIESLDENFTQKLKRIQ